MKKIGIGKRLKSLRKRLGLTQKEFAQRVAGKVDYTYIPASAKHLGNPHATRV